MTTRRTVLAGALLTLFVGCASAPRAEPAPLPQVPEVLHGTWRGTDGVFLLIGADRTVINLHGIAPTTRRVVGVERVAGGAVLALEGGWVLSLAAGRGMQVRRHGGIEMAADCPVVDLGLSGPPAPVTVRLVGDGSATWLPTAPVPAVAAQPAGDPADRGFIEAIADLGDPGLEAAAERLVRLARAGLPDPELAAVCTEAVRRRQLVVLELWQEVEGPHDPRIAAGDRILADADAFTRTYRAWR